MSSIAVETPDASKQKSSDRRAPRKKSAARSAAALLLATALLATVAVDFYLASTLPEAGSDISASSSRRSVSSPADAAADGSWACVRKVPSSPDRSDSAAERHRRDVDRFLFGDRKRPRRPPRRGRRLEAERRAARPPPDGPRCEPRPCALRDGAFVPAAPPPPFGYAGRFARRDPGLERRAMARPGGGAWASGCVVSDRHRFVYVHVLKSGGTAVKNFLRGALCGEGDGGCERVDPEVVRPMLCRRAVTEHSDYFVFSFVRNPYSRAYSMYSMMDGFPISPSQRGKVTESVSFEKFLRTDPTQRKKYTKMHRSHYYNQTDFLFSKNDCPSFDYLGRVEHFDDDMRTILEHLDATRILRYLDGSNGTIRPANTWGASKKRSLGADLRGVYDASPEARERVVRDYGRDFELLGYDPREVPAD